MVFNLYTLLSGYSNTEILHIFARLLNHPLFSENIKEIKNVPSTLLSKISTQDFFFKNTREVLEKHELQANASCNSRVFLKTSHVLI